MLSIVWSLLPDNDWWALPVFLCKLNPIKARWGKGSRPFSSERSATFPPRADHVLVDLFSSVAARGGALRVEPPLHWTRDYMPIKTCLKSAAIWPLIQESRLWGSKGSFLLIWSNVQLDGCPYLSWNTHTVSPSNVCLTACARAGHCKFTLNRSSSAYLTYISFSVPFNLLFLTLGRKRRG